MVLCLAHSYSGKEFKVAITAFTHTAIDGLLRQIKERLDKSFPDLKLDLLKLVSKSQLEKSDRNIEIGEVSNEKLVRFSQSISIVGGTCWSFFKNETKRFKNSKLQFDLIVTDEASQVPVNDSAILFRFLKPQEGRIVYCGDLQQLPPIVRADYPIPNQIETAVLTKSIFYCLFEKNVFASLSDEEKEAALSKDRSQVIDMFKPGTRGISLLKESFRMNSSLCLYPSKILYKGEYSSHPSVSRSKFEHFFSDHDENAISKFALDSEKPLVFLIFDEQLEDRIRRTSYSDARHPEVMLIKRILEGIFPRQLDLLTSDLGSMNLERKQGKGAPAFGKSIFVITPHHEQRIAIAQMCRRLLSIPRSQSSIAKDGAEVVINTVEKLQGQECEMSIVAYSFTQDKLFKSGSTESRFILDRNRINVSTTRAKKKTIVLLTRSMLDFHPKIFDRLDPKPMEAFHYLRGMKEAANILDVTAEMLDVEEEEKEEEEGEGNE